jgi:hypothetical protein
LYFERAGSGRKMWLTRISQSDGMRLLILAPPSSFTVHARGVQSDYQLLILSNHSHYFFILISQSSLQINTNLISLHRITSTSCVISPALRHTPPQNLTAIRCVRNAQGSHYQPKTQLHHHHHHHRHHHHQHHDCLCSPL